MRLHDMKHIYWLISNSIKQLFKGDINETKEALYLIRVHLKYESKKKS